MDLEFIKSYEEQISADLEGLILWFHLYAILEMAKDRQKPHQCLPGWRWERVIYQGTESEGTNLHTCYSVYEWTYLQKLTELYTKRDQIYYMQNIYNLKQKEKKGEESWLQTGKNKKLHRIQSHHKLW